MNLNKSLIFVLCFMAGKALSIPSGWEDDWKALAPAPIVSGLYTYYTKDDWSPQKKAGVSLSTIAGTYVGAWIGRGIVVEVTDAFINKSIRGDTNGTEGFLSGLFGMGTRAQLKLDALPIAGEVSATVGYIGGGALMVYFTPKLWDFMIYGAGSTKKMLLYHTGNSPEGRSEREVPSKSDYVASTVFSGAIVSVAYIIYGLVKRAS